MARRIEIELTSARDDGTWTWRAVGAREPRGVIDAKVLAQGARVGDVLRVEAEFGLDGIAVVAVLPPKERERRDNRIEIVTSRQEGTVTTSLVSRGGRGRPGGDRGPRGEEGRERGGTRRGEAGGREGAPERRGARRGPAEARRGPAEARRGPVEARRGRPSGEPPARPEAPAARRPAQERPGRTRPARLVPGTAHRDALFDTLPPEQRPIAEQLAVGGLPAVRRALAEQQAAARAEGRPAAGGDAIVALAEQLLPSVKEATWLDRAEAVSGRLDTVSLRDLRAAVTSAAARDAQGRELLHRLREALDERLTKLRSAWEHDIAHALEEGRVLQALRLSARPPEPTARFPAALVQPVVDAAGNALSATTPVERWLALLEAAVISPVRRSIKPSGIPEDPSGAVRQAATLAAGRIPALAPLLGLAMPPPPRPAAPGTARRTPPPPRPGGAPRAATPSTPPSAPEAPRAPEHPAPPPVPSASEPATTEPATTAPARPAAEARPSEVAPDVADRAPAAALEPLAAKEAAEIVARALEGATGEEEAAAASLEHVAAGEPAAQPAEPEEGAEERAPAAPNGEHGVRPAEPPRDSGAPVDSAPEPPPPAFGSASVEAGTGTAEKHDAVDDQPVAESLDEV